MKDFTPLYTALVIVSFKDRKIVYFFSCPVVDLDFSNFLEFSRVHRSPFSRKFFPFSSFAYLLWKAHPARKVPPNHLCQLNLFKPSGASTTTHKEKFTVPPRRKNLLQSSRVIYSPGLLPTNAFAEFKWMQFLSPFLDFLGRRTLQSNFGVPPTKPFSTKSKCV